MRMNKLTLVSACIAGMFLVACSDGGGISNTLTPTVAPVAELSSKARYSIVLKNAITKEIINTSLSITFAGDAELKAADGTSLNGKTITTTDGVVALGATFSDTAKDFSVLAGNREAGWIQTGTRVLGDSSVSGDHTVELLLVNTGQAAAINASAIPVSMTTASGMVTSSGALTATVSLGTPTKTVTNAEGVSETIGSSTLTLPVGVIGTTASGQPAAAGPLSVSVVNYANSSAESMSAFPGGFAATVSGAPASVLNGAAADGGSFISGGFAQFNVTDSNGNAIRNFNPPISVSIDLPKGTFGADRVTPLKPGDSFPIWSYDDATGVWKFEKEGAVSEKTPVDSGNYTVAFTTSHLSSWNLDFYVPTCTAQINLTGRPAGDTRQLEVEVTGFPGQRYSYSFNVEDSQLDLQRAPMGTTVKVEVKDQGVVVGSASNQTLCPGPISIPVVLKSNPVGTIRVETSESCSDGTQKRAVPTFTRVIYGTTSTVVSGYTTVAGTAVASEEFGSIPVAGTKTVYALNPRTSVYESKPVAVTANDTATVAFNFPMNCSASTGAGN